MKLDKRELTDYSLLPEYWGWMLYPLNGGKMQRVNLPTFYVYGRIMSEAKVVDAHDKIGDTEVLRHLLAVSIWTEFFLAATKNVSLPSTRDAAKSVKSIIKEHTSKLKPHVDEPDYNAELGEYFVKRLIEEIEAFELLFDRESQRISVFIVEPKGIYDTEKLIESAEKRFPENLLKVMPALTIEDLKEAGRCFAFDLPTACAFHACRATEGLMRAYYKHLTGNDWPPPPPKPKMRPDWKVLVDQLEVEGAPIKTIQRLREIRDDRNSFAHPDVSVPLKEAPIVYDLCHGAMFAVAQEMA